MNQISLSVLAAKINDTHKAAEEQAGQVIRLAIEAGEHLFRAKEQVQHGQWASWFNANINFSRREAQVYMRMFRYREEIEHADPPLTTIDAALGRIGGHQPIDENLSTEIAGIIHLAYIRMESTINDLHEAMEKGNLSELLIMRVLRHDCGFERVISRIEKQIKEAEKQKKSINHFAESMLQVAKEYIDIARDWRSKHAPYAVDLEHYYRIDGSTMTGFYSDRGRTTSL